jgi:23S rRNA (cytosine1962-C5)-methyltransferase
MIQLLHQHWNEYALLDSGNGEKLERFGTHVLIRPEPQAVWSPTLSAHEWEHQAHAIFRRSGKDQQQERGVWQIKPKVAEQWKVSYQGQGFNLTFRLGMTAFKHVGLFPEQAAHWEYLYRQLSEKLPTGAKVLNLFAYTGGSSLAARAAGAEVTHLDSVKQVISWARENMELSRLDHIKWLVEDAMKFVQREERRGNSYQAILLDPPAYGRGPDGEKWQLEDQINEMLRCCATLLKGEQVLLLINLYSLGFSALVLDNLLKEHFGKVLQPELGELYLQDQFGKKLPLGTYGRFVGGKKN